MGKEKAVRMGLGENEFNEGPRLVSTLRSPRTNRRKAANAQQVLKHIQMCLGGKIKVSHVFGSKGSCNKTHVKLRRV